MNITSIPTMEQKTMLLVRKRVVLSAPAILGLFCLSGCCDPVARINLQNNYTVPVTVHLVGNATQGIANQVLDTVPPGKRVALANTTTMAGDIDSIQIEDAQGHVLTHLSSAGANVVCKQKTPNYVWEITVGP